MQAATEFFYASKCSETSLKNEFLILVLTLFLSIYICISYVELGLAQESDIVISSDNSFVNEIGNLHVVGEVENNSPNTVQFVRIIGTFYDSGQNVVATGSTFTDPTDLASGEKAPFDLILTQASIPLDDIDDYTLKVSWDEPDKRITGEKTIDDIITKKDSTEPCLTISGVYNLTSNLTCHGDGLVVTSDNTVINMNGYSLVGPGVKTSTAGIFDLEKDNLMINGPGSISNFQAGMFTREVNGLNISSIILENNDIGYSLINSTDIVIPQNIIKNNNVGIGSDSNLHIKVVSNLVTGNLFTGITFLNTNGSEVSMNNVDGSQNGIFLDTQSSENNIVANNVLQNVVDIKDNDDNQFTGNSCQTSEPDNLC